MLPRRSTLALIAATVVLVFTSTASVCSAAEKVSPRDAFAALKALAGEWTGTVTDREKGPPVKVVYRVTAGGSAVEELLFPGTPHEMVTMYHLDGEKLVLTHYCAMGNQPHMSLASSATAEHLIFEFESAGNLASADAPHMHSGRIHIVDANTLEASWDVFDKGEKAGENRFFLKRK